MQYTTARELGRGGEGVVYELQNDGSRVLKQYTEPLTPQRIQKLHKMVLMRTPDIDAYAAWPQALVRDVAGNVCGFVMKKLAGFVPLHMIFSPLDRKKMFPDKGYNFLVHVARNLAIAFHKLHEAGLVVGDVNEGNILINASGMVSFIDCDSFQVRGDDGWFYCEVGVPRYTPPELLEAQTFEQVVRTANTDSFSMAVLLFQLLFLGRHPFAGRNKTAADIDEETAIRMREFAYSLTSKKKKLLPPNNSFDINNLSQPLVGLFHKAFETADRPLPVEWARELDGFLLQMVTCTESRIHVYPSGMKECPWCAFRKQQGIMYFLDDSYLHANSILNDIDTFVNGFRTEKLELKKWEGRLTEDLSVVAAPISAEWHKYGIISISVSVAIFIGAVLMALFYGALLVFPGLGLIVVWRKYGPIGRRKRTEKTNRAEWYMHAQAQLNKSIAEYDRPHDLPAYNNEVQKLARLIQDFKHLPEEHDKLKKAAEEHIYNDYLHAYLRQFDVLSHPIASFGQAKKGLLLNVGIRNAADISLLRTQKVAGIGPKNMQVLFDWQRQMASGFVYIPDADKLAIGMQQAAVDINLKKQKLEHGIRQQYQAVNYMKLNINNRALVLENQIKDLITRTSQAKADMIAFDAYSKFI